MDEMATELHIAEEKSKKAMVDAARLADELRQEQEYAPRIAEAISKNIQKDYFIQPTDWDLKYHIVRTI